MKRLILTLPIAILFLVSNKSSSQQPTFPGTWIFKNQVGVSGNVYPNGSPKQVTITQDLSNIQINSLIYDGKKDTIISEKFEHGATHLDSKTQRGRKKIVSITWSTGNMSFTEVSDFYSLTDPNKLDYKDTDIWVLKDSELLLDRKDENYVNGETWESQATYERQ